MIATPAASKHLPAAERRSETIKAFVELASHNDPAQITTAAIATQMGLTQGALFRHFASKDELLLAVVDWVGGLMGGGLFAGFARPEEPLQCLQEVFKRHVEFLAAHPGVPRILISELQRARSAGSKQNVLDLMDNYRSQIALLLRRARAAGLLDDSFDIGVASYMYMGLTQGLATRMLLSGNVRAMRSEAPKVFAIFIRGLGGKLVAGN